MHPALHSWREELPSAFVRLLAYMGAIAMLSTVASQVFPSPPVIDPITPAHRSEWIDIEKPFPAFALFIPEAADVPASYAIRRHVDGGGRKDILALGAPEGAAPHLRVEIYRAGSEARGPSDPQLEITQSAAALRPVNVEAAEPLPSKFGPLSIVTFDASAGATRHCLGFVRGYDNPRMQLSGWFCQVGTEFVERSMLTCALDRLALLAAGSEPKIGALFAQAELNRSYCGQRNTLLAPTPKHGALWSKTAPR